MRFLVQTTMPRYLLALSCWILAYGCSTSVPTQQVDYLSSIRSESDFTLLEGKPLSAKFSHITSVKVVYDLSNRQLYFINGKLYKYHYDFVADYLGNKEDLYVFNERNYTEDKRKRQYLLGNLNRIKGTRTFFLELSPSDQMDIASISVLYDQVKERCLLEDSLFFYVNNFRLIEAHEKDLLKMPSIKSEDLFGTEQYQQISEGKTSGILKKYTLEELAESTPGKNEIILINGTPLTLPQVQGIIVTELQTPLSHLVLLGRNRRIPIAAQLNAWTDERLEELIGKVVLFEPKEDSLNISPSDKPLTGEIRKEPLMLKKDLSKTELVSLDRVPSDGKDYIGSKAYHFACLNAISTKKGSFKVPEYGFAIPFYFYEQHIQNCGAAQKIYNLGKIPPANLKDELKKIRKSILAYPLDKNLLYKVESRLKSQEQFSAFRFRSSTNAEDLGEFNGAGLYDSKSAILGDTSKTVEKAIKKVWASVWSEAAYTEREIFRIKQETVAMGILVHRSFPEEIANGVVITANIYRENDGITVNVQKGESSVVLPEKGVTTEIFTAYKYEQPPWDNRLIVDYTSHSPLNNYKPILNEREMEALYRACKDIELGMVKYWQQDAVCDIEFKLVGEKRELYIKQVRKY